MASPRLAASMSTSSSRTESETLPPPMSHPPLQRSSSHNSKIFSLNELGFSSTVCDYALQLFEDDVTLASSWLADPSNADLLKQIENQSVSTEMGLETKESDEGDMEIDDFSKSQSLSSPKAMPMIPQLTLLNIRGLDSIKASHSFLFHFTNILTRIEDWSHILVWVNGSVDPMSLVSLEDIMETVAFIEMPRLKLKLQPRKTTDGGMKMFVVDHSGWFVADFNWDCQSTAQRRHFTNAIPSTLRQSGLILENMQHEMSLLLPNFDLYKPRLKGQPFGGEVLSHKGSMPWQQVMDSRFFMLKLHSTGLIQCNTLAATLYLILRLSMAGEYSTAARMIAGSHVDVPFSAEEQWIWQQFERTIKDQYPDAVALRLRLTLAMRFSGNKTLWEPKDELDMYLSSLPHVSKCCLLTPEEEWLLLRSCAAATPRIRNRMEFYQASRMNLPVAILKAPRPKQGGRPWEKLSQMRMTYLDQHGANITKMHFVPPNSAQPGLLKNNEALDIIWAEHLLMDNESGSTMQLGAVFLFLLFRNSIRVNICDRSCTQGYAQIMTRLFQLKLSRWGKEAISEGETEHVPSKIIAIMQMVYDQPDAVWPVLPSDRETNYLLQNGINLYGREGRNSALKQFLDTISLQCESMQSTIGWTDWVNRRRGIVGALTVADHPVLCPGSSCKSMKFEPHEFRAPLVGVRDFGCSEIKLAPESWNDSLKLTFDTLKDFANFPLAPVGLAELVKFCKLAPIASDLPFSVEHHASAKTIVAQDMLNRLKQDTAGYAETTNNTAVPNLICNVDLTSDSMDTDSQKADLESSISQLGILKDRLVELRSTDSDFLFAALNKAVEVANELPEDVNDINNLAFALRRQAGRETPLCLEWLLGAVMSRDFVDELQRHNPFLSAEVCNELRSLLVTAELHANRMSHASRALSVAERLQSQYRTMLVSDSALSDNELCQQSEHTSLELARLLATKRFCMTLHVEPTEEFPNGYATMDPRYLLFEFLFDILLRERQVEMVGDFLDAVRGDRGRVQQMIMGAGKTTVVGPLLSLILADGERLVTQVMPTALLEQSRNIFRERFAVIVPKRVFTLRFDRGCEDDPGVMDRVFDQLETCLNHRGIVCAAPECVKSLMLKFVEQLHSIQELDPSTIKPLSTSKRHSEEVTRLRDVMISRSDMADSSVKILDMWGNGVVVMDEVDVLLHPLKSELNFPIGSKRPIDLAGARWDLPMFILDSLFAVHSSKLTDSLEIVAPAFMNDKDNAVSILENIASAIDEGYKTHCLQKSPHLVLLDKEYYFNKLAGPMADWVLLWLSSRLKGDRSSDMVLLKQYLLQQDVESIRNDIEGGLLPESKKLLNLASTWVAVLLPHCLAKINRVSFGLLTAADLNACGPRTPLSRKLMAVPFVGKDVPSQSSEFAHPDVLIGLTILAYRYEGMRLGDSKRVVQQLKRDFSRQMGPRDQRKAYRTFREWVTRAVSLQETEKISSSDSMVIKSCGDVDLFAVCPNIGQSLPILPLPLFQPSDQRQLLQLFALVRHLPEFSHYYLRQHVFPACLNFQKLKISACGMELGSNILFKHRIGFSGTPSNLLPMDLGQCEYEPGSDGRIVRVLTDPAVVSTTFTGSWSAQSLLKAVAKASPSFHALIDTGALITGLSNEEVARFLLNYLPEIFEGVVYLDQSDRQMIILRSGATMLLAQCGVGPSKRFTFYDQVHTTGMDIKQAPSAVAVVTLGKDMTFRDYAQGSFRMRGIGNGQRIHLFIIPEVEQRIKQELNLDQTSSELVEPHLQVPGWLLVNSMRMESLQFVQMSNQELNNVWRKTSLRTLLSESRDNILPVTADGSERMKRLRRFLVNEHTTPKWLSRCIEQYREPVNYEVPDHVPMPHSLAEKLQELVEENKEMVSDESFSRVDEVLYRVVQVAKATSEEDQSANLNAECVHENEQEAEEEAEEEAEQEEQKMSDFCRDEEQHLPWKIIELMKPPPKGLMTIESQGDCPFYSMSQFKTQKEDITLNFPDNLYVTDNFFKLLWIGLGDRRLKNVTFLLQWEISSASKQIANILPIMVKQMTTGCGNTACNHPLCASNSSVSSLPPSQAAAKAAMTIVPSLQKDFSETKRLVCPNIQKSQIVFPKDGSYVVCLSLAEGETIRRILHSHSHDILKNTSLALYTLDGTLVDRSLRHNPSQNKSFAILLQCLRFFNCDMFYTPIQLQLLLEAMQGNSIEHRRLFFERSVRLRRRERHLWEDTPLAKLFTAESEWHMLPIRARLEQVFRAMVHHKSDPISAFLKNDNDHDGILSPEECLQALMSLGLGFAPQEMRELVGTLDHGHIGCILFDDYCGDLKVGELQAILEAEQAKEQQASMFNERWRCMRCTYLNETTATVCSICELGWDGQRTVPTGKWMCDPETGGCTFFNPNNQFYCEMCSRSKPDLASMRF